MAAPSIRSTEAALLAERCQPLEGAARDYDPIIERIAEATPVLIRQAPPATDGASAVRARHRSSCFEQFGEDSQAYGWATSLGITKSCEDAAVQQLLELRQRAPEIFRDCGAFDDDELFYAEENARSVRDAEEY